MWTGDNARHGPFCLSLALSVQHIDLFPTRADIDTRLPRSLPEIFDLNRYVVDRVREAFGNKVPVIASIGNNDIYPHNVMFAGRTCAADPDATS